MDQRYYHQEHGECEHLRTVGIYWIVRFRGSPHERKLSPSDREKLTPVPTVVPGAGVGATPAGPSGVQSQPPAESAASPDPSVGSGGSRWELGSILDRLGFVRGATSAPTQPSWMTAQPQPTTPSAVMPSAPRPPTDPESRRLRQAFESLRTGLSPATADLRPFAVGADVIERHADDFFKRIDDGGASKVFRGGYGLGKTFNLQLLRELALEQNFCVMLTEIDSNRNQLHKPNSVIRSLMQSLRFPDHEETGPDELVRQVHEHLREQFKHEQFREASPHQWPWGLARLQHEHLKQELECVPLSWLFSDPMLPDKEQLIALLACDPQERESRTRLRHILFDKDLPVGMQWPVFSKGTQGDFGSYYLSGVGRLCRLLGYRGLIVLLDEMEKWENLNWREQSRAGNLLGGLLWAASARGAARKCAGNRVACSHSTQLTHSGHGGHPFTTHSPCYLGVGIALTPRGNEGPEADWAVYGDFETIELPEFTPTGLKEYFNKIYPLYCRGYGLHEENPAELVRQALNTWLRNPDRSTRMGVRAVMSVLDAWRESVAGT
ncbi:MAG: DUF2791 family P-loop domain-containing protein [Planctomycetales bacterium]|nr:DUF2791 family P-loop domain-containing protein [Planctomycetales bacterium]